MPASTIGSIEPRGEAATAGFLCIYPSAALMRGLRICALRGLRICASRGLCALTLCAIVPGSCSALAAILRRFTAVPAAQSVPGLGPVVMNLAPMLSGFTGAVIVTTQVSGMRGAMCVGPRIGPSMNARRRAWMGSGRSALTMVWCSAETNGRRATSRPWRGHMS
jgi:hypothetical protein